MPANITINEAPKEPPADSGSFKGFSKAESDSITTVGLGLGAIVGGYLLLNYLDAQGYITQVLNGIGIGNGDSTGTTPAGTGTTPPTVESDYAYRTHAQAQAQNQILRTDFAKYSPDLSDISGDVEYKLHSDDSNLGAIEDPDDQYYYENADFSPGRSQAYAATLEHDPRTDISTSYLGQEDGVIVRGYEGVVDDVISYAAEEGQFVPSDLSRYRVERDTRGNLLDVSLSQ
jgi:hypothetical protein